jgi:hypothetical protein
MHFRVCINYKYNKYMYVYNNVKREEHLKTSKASAVFVSWALIYSNICQQPKISATKVSFKVQRDFVLYIYLFFLLHCLLLTIASHCTTQAG